MIADLRLAFRQIRRHPGFAAAVVLTVALGVGAVAAVFTLADPMLFRPLPFAGSDRIVQVRVNGGGPTGMLQLPDYFALEAGSASFEAVMSFQTVAAGRVDGTDQRHRLHASPSIRCSRSNASSGSRGSWQRCSARSAS